MDVTLRLSRGIPDVPWARHELLSVLEHESEVQADPDRVGLVVTELLTNALLHGQEPVEVHAAVVDDHLRIEVHDASKAVPEERHTEPTAVTGRGLMLVAGLVERWGVDQSGDGKCVWAEFESPTQTSATPGRSGSKNEEIQLPDVARSSSHRSSTAHGARKAAWVASMPGVQLRTTSQ